ncbi:MAG: DNA alkylation repair protein [bacterium]
MLYREIIHKLKKLSNPESVAGMQRFGIQSKHMLGISMPTLRALAKDLGENHKLALQLWNSGIHDAQILATMVDIPELVTEKQMEQWVIEFDSWAICDQCCNNLFYKTPFAYRKAVKWSKRKEEYVKRAGFVLMAVLAVHDQDATDKQFLSFLPIIKRESGDPRNFVKKAVNWALRQIGKRNRILNQAAIDAACQIQQLDSKPARWIAADALRELTNANLKTKKQKN